MKSIKVALVAMPWRGAHMTAFRVDSLKPYLGAQGIQADDFYLYLDVAAAMGRDRYQAVIRKLQFEIFFQEAFYSYLLFPEMRERTVAFLQGIDWSDDLRPLLAEWETIHQQVFDAVDWAEYPLVVIPGGGVVSAPFSNFLAGIYAAREIKRRSPQSQVLLAGSDYVSEIGQSVLQYFHWVDYVINGETEIPLSKLALAMSQGQNPAIPGVLHRAADGSVNITSAEQIRHLDELPMQDFSAYLTHPAIIPEETFFYLEGARGCWWDRSNIDPRHSCQFCCINGQWKGYRTKSVPRILEQVQTLVDQYGARHLIFADHITPPHHLTSLYAAIADLNLGLRLDYVEAHVSVTPDALVQMKRAGVEVIQFGIESLLPELLARMNKGTSFPRIVQILRACHELGLALFCNLIPEYPGTTQSDVAETLRRLKLIRYFPPLSVFDSYSVFNLGHGSPIAMRPETVGITRIYNDPNYRHFLPESLVNGLTLHYKSFDRPGPKADWTPVKNYLEACQQEFIQNPAAYQMFAIDDGERLQLQARSPGTPDRRLLLPGWVRTLYLTCLEGRRLKFICEAIPEQDPTLILNTLENLVSLGFMLFEDDHYMSLAIRVSRDGAPSMASKEERREPVA